MNSITPIITYLEIAHSELNVNLFGGALKKPVITVQTQGKKSCYGWFWSQRWQNTTEQLDEINFSAEYLKRPIKEIGLTLIHEMVHQYANTIGIKDTSRAGRWHNKKFAGLAEKAGLVAPKKPDPKHGYAFVSWGDRAAKAFDSIDSTEFLLARNTLAAKKKGTGKMLLWQCLCETKIQSGRQDLNITCNDCGAIFELRS